MGNMTIKDILELIDKNVDIKSEILQNLISSIKPSAVVSYMTDYFNDMCITISGIADIAKKTPQAVVSMIKSNEEDFPSAYNVNGTNVYIRKDVIDWLINNNKIARSEDDVVQQEYLIGTEKTIVITGGPGNAKSTVAVSASEAKVVKILKRIFTAGGSADTENLIKLHFKNSSVNYVVFHYSSDGCNDTIPIKISEDNVERIKDELKKCKEKAKLLREGKNIEALSGIYVELVLNPNKIVSKLMHDCNISILTFIDTPGIDSDHSGESVSIADVVVIALGDRDNIKEIARNIKENVVPKTGACQYIYLYNNRFWLDSMNVDNWESVYDECFQEAKEYLKDYETGLKELKDELVIGTTLSVCNPFDSLVCIPALGREPNRIDEFFYSKFCEKLKEALNNSLYYSELNAFVSTLNEKYLDLMNKILKELFCNLQSSDAVYNIDTFKSEKHGRTKSNDNYRLEYSYNKCMRELKKYFYDIFSEFKTEECNEEMAAVIRMVYLTICEGIMNKVHYGSGSHPWEDINSPTQMICEEILSKEIVKDQQKGYCAVLKDNGIESNSWNYVYTNPNAWNKAKLLISDQFSLPEFNAQNIDDYIKVCHYFPSILVQAVLVYFKGKPSGWNNISYVDVVKEIMKDIVV